MGRPLYSNRNGNITYVDKNNVVKLPISSNGRSCIAMDVMNNGETIYVKDIMIRLKLQFMIIRISIFHICSKYI